MGLYTHTHTHGSFKEREKGITLIALVITIIVLLILAGVSIAMLTGNNGILKQAGDAKVMTNLSKVDEAIKLYKSSLKINKVVDEGSEQEVTNDDLITYGVLKEYVIEETLRPIAVVEGYEKLEIKDKFGEGYKNISSYEVTGENIPYIGTLNELNNVCAIDLIDGTLYYLENGKVWSIEGKTEIANNYERVNAEEGEWTFDSSTKTLTAYLGDLTTKRGKQEVGEVIIPNYYNGNRVKFVRDWVFQENEEITSVVISRGIQEIGVGTFYKCSNLKGRLIIPDSMTQIGMHAFNGCSGMTGDLIIPDSVEGLGKNAFSGCSGLDGKLILSKNIKVFNDGVFWGCTNLNINVEDVIKKDTTFIGSNAFRGCSNLKGKLILPDELTSIGDFTFYQCSGLVGDLIIPNNVTTIGMYAFGKCTGFTGKLRMSNKIKYIGKAAFCDDSGLTGDIIIPEGVESIGEATFIGCSSIESIAIKDATCLIYDGADTIDSKIRIKGYSGSTAEEYATKYNRMFEVIQ